VIKDSGKLGPNDRLINILEGNVYIRGDGAKVLSDRRYYSGGEQRHGIFIFGASNVFIEGLESSGHSGDGYYIGGPVGHPAQNITLENCAGSNNRRQGLSITSAQHVSIDHCFFSDTKGTAPQFGIDVEPNSGDVLENIRIIDARTENNYGGGIQIYLGALLKAKSRQALHPISIQIIDHKSIGERHPYATFGIDRVPGTVRYTAAR